MTKKPKVYIEDFEMPKCCKECPFIVYWSGDNETSCKASKHFYGMILLIRLDIQNVLSKFSNNIS